VTGVALMVFLALALAADPVVCATLIIWLFVMRSLMIVTSLASYFINEVSARRCTAARRTSISKRR
jgi:K(+)-stimulated pyrophosphate-energized sodium pump